MMMTGKLLQELYRFLSQKAMKGEITSCSLGGPHKGFPPEIRATMRDGFGRRHTLVLSAVEINHDDDARWNRCLRLWGADEVAEYLGVPLAEVEGLAKRPDFPIPAATLKATPVWCTEDIEKYKEKAT